MRKDTQPEDNLDDHIDYQTRSPVLFLVFNRPDTTRKVFEAIRQAKPSRLYVAADGPRSNRTGEAEKCEEVRRIAAGVSWDCEVKTLFRQENLGCKHAVSGALDWFFREEPEGIVLEDDCLPSSSFFRFCDEMLERFRHDTRVFLVSGYNKQGSWKEDKHDYFFSNYGGIWGWASWAGVWQHYDLEMSMLDSAIERRVLRHLLGNHHGKAREELLLNVRDHVDTWDYQFSFARNINNGLACVPSINLIENIGFGADATHTKSVAPTGAGRVIAGELSYPLRDNPFMVPDRDYDAKFFPVRNPIVAGIAKLTRAPRKIVKIILGAIAR